MKLLNLGYFILVVQISKYAIGEQDAGGQDEQSVFKVAAGLLMHLPIFLQRSSPLLCMIIGE